MIVLHSLKLIQLLYWSYIWFFKFFKFTKQTLLLKLGRCYYALVQMYAPHITHIVVQLYFSFGLQSIRDRLMLVYATKCFCYN